MCHYTVNSLSLEDVKCMYLLIQNGTLLAFVPLLERVFFDIQVQNVLGCNLFYRKLVDTQLAVSALYYFFFISPTVKIQSNSLICRLIVESSDHRAKRNASSMGQTF